MPTLSKVHIAVVSLFIFLFPLVFLPFSQEYFVTTKFYFLAFSAVILFVITFLRIQYDKEYILKKTFVLPFTLLLVAYTCTLLFVTPNKIQALLNPYSLVTLLSFMVLSFNISSFSKKEISTLLRFLIYSSGLLTSATLLFLVKPFSYISLPFFLQFLNTPYFTLTGDMISQSIILAGSLIPLAFTFFVHFQVKVFKEKRYNLVAFVYILIGLILSLFISFNTSLFSQKISYTTSLQSYLVTFHTPPSSLLGVGIDNFNSAFTKSKSSVFNLSSQWEKDFTSSGSFILHIGTENGILGLISFVLILGFALKLLLYHKKHHKELFLFHFVYIAFLIFCLVFLPPSLMTFFLLFLVLGYMGTHTPLYDEQEIRLPSLIKWGALMAVVIVALTGFYFLGKAYRAEYFFKQSLNSLAQNDAYTAYNFQKKAISFNPSHERMRIQFSELNLLLANNLASKENITPTEKQNIKGFIQAALSEGAAVIKLNPQKASYWAHLGRLYHTIIKLVPDGAAWAVSSYQRASALDPYNPHYYIEAGIIYFQTSNYPEAESNFSQAVKVKPDLFAGYYNLALLYNKEERKEEAIDQMKKALEVAKANSTEYKKAETYLQEWK